ncbi:competence protein ComK [Apilactobacillus apisilvae]|uniref:Competence protein ComK n=1 Tax=Apilactobacillus apisilvae TaxID=2923364 RepID=A0ABY4PH33_9LACO|nr:competence protein ComK [Apilactobacillus apisilvae]UQS84953.1 competence protein ComK [Apilactobacillus apisilvae]
MLTSISKDPVRTNYLNNSKCVRFKDLRYSHIIRKVKNHQPNWDKIIMLLDFNEHSKKYPTLVIEKDVGFYLTDISINVIINQNIKQNQFSNQQIIKMFCDSLNLKNTYPLISNNSILIALPKNNRGSCNHSWINPSYLDYFKSAKNKNETEFLLADNQFISLPVTEKYVDNKINDSKKLKNYLKTLLIALNQWGNVNLQDAKLSNEPVIPLKDLIDKLIND